MVIEEAYSLLKHNTFGINVRCSRFIEYDSELELRQVLSSMVDVRSGNVLHIGSGSNLLFTKDFNGTILHSAIKGKSVEVLEDGSVLVKVGAGENWDDFVGWCVEHGYYGLENLSYIPGEVGASAVQNIGAYGSEVGDYIEYVETVDLFTGESRIFAHDECNYAYRKSIFKEEMKGHYAVTYVAYRLSKEFHPDLSYAALLKEIVNRHIDRDSLTADVLRRVVIDVRRGKLPEPQDLGSAGSFFVNPMVDERKFSQLQAEYLDIPHYRQADGVKIPAGWLIEQCGWKGKRLDKVGVYEKQALVLVNYGGATGQDIVDLSEAVREDVFKKFGIEIRPEVNFI